MLLHMCFRVRTKELNLHTPHHRTAPKGKIVQNTEKLLEFNLEN